MANTLSFNRNVWERKWQNRLYGFNTDPATNRVDEYELYNRLRREQYAREDELDRHKMRWFAIAIAVLLLILATQL